jgi:hypothetical protein
MRAKAFASIIYHADHEPVLLFGSGGDGYVYCV